MDNGTSHYREFRRIPRFGSSCPQGERVPPVKNHWFKLSVVLFITSCQYKKEKRVRYLLACALILVMQCTCIGLAQIRKMTKTNWKASIVLWILYLFIHPRLNKKKVQICLKNFFFRWLVLKWWKQIKSIRSQCPFAVLQTFPKTQKWQKTFKLFWTNDYTTLILYRSMNQIERNMRRNSFPKGLLLTVNVHIEALSRFPADRHSHARVSSRVFHHSAADEDHLSIGHRPHPLLLIRRNVSERRLVLGGRHDRDWRHSGGIVGRD